MSKKPRIAQIAPLWIPVPPRTYGGIELMVYNLVEELIKREYKISLIASGDSKTTAELIPIIEKGIWLEHNLKNPHASIIRLVKILFDRFRDFDLIHNHFNFFPFPLSLHSNCPLFLTTVHNPVDYQYAKTMLTYDKVKFCAISNDHKKSMEEQGVPVIGVVPNGIEVKRYEFNNSPDDYFLYLSRLNKGKGIITAIEAAKMAGKKLIVAGNIVGDEEWFYFMREIQPLLNSENICFRGQVNFNEKIQLLKNAKALLFPIERREPFGLVMVESMACGTPVIGFNNGSVPEIIKHGETGFVVNSKEEMIAMMEKIDEISRLACRKRVEENFTVKKMVDAYEKIYNQIIG